MIITIHGGKKKTKKQREKDRLAWKTQQEKYKLRPLSGRSFTPVVKVVDTLDLNKHRLATNLPSKDTGVRMAVKKEVNTYTGDQMIGIGTLHKSNLVPIFKNDEAKEIASMRRS